MGRLICLILPSIPHGFICLNPGEIWNPILSLIVYLRFAPCVAFPTFAPSVLVRSTTGDLALRAPIFSGLYCYWVGSLLLVLVSLDSAFLFSQRVGARVCAWPSRIHHNLLNFSSSCSMMLVHTPSLFHISTFPPPATGHTH